MFLYKTGLHEWVCRREYWTPDNGAQAEWDCLRCGDHRIRPTMDGRPRDEHCVITVAVDRPAERIRELRHRRFVRRTTEEV